MSRTAPKSNTNKIVAVIIAVVIIVAGGLGVRYQLDHNKSSNQPVSSSSANQTVSTTDISYQGQDTKNALELLKTHAKVVTKTSAGLGEYVVSI
ncbi:MAG: hypothetical protein ACREGC_03860, partial [Minisyncoccia bacterium]